MYAAPVKWTTTTGHSVVLNGNGFAVDKAIQHSLKEASIQTRESTPTFREINGRGNRAAIPVSPFYREEARYSS